MECGRGLEAVINLSKNDWLCLSSLILILLTLDLQVLESPLSMLAVRLNFNHVFKKFTIEQFINMSSRQHNCKEKLRKELSWRRWNGSCLQYMQCADVACCKYAWCCDLIVGVSAWNDRLHPADNRQLVELAVWALARPFRHDVPHRVSAAQRRSVPAGRAGRQLRGGSPVPVEPCTTVPLLTPLAGRASQSAEVLSDGRAALPHGSWRSAVC